MMPVAVPECNYMLDPPKDWDEAKDGPCHSMKVINKNGVFKSFWKPDEKELAALNSGGFVLVAIASSGHPPIAIGTVELQP